MLNQTGAITHVNGPVCAACGRVPRGALISTPLVDIMMPATVRVLGRRCCRPWTAGTRGKATSWLLHKTDGKRSGFSVALSPITDGDKQLREDCACSASDMDQDREGVSESAVQQNTYELLQEITWSSFNPRLCLLMYANDVVAKNNLMRHDGKQRLGRGRSLSDLIGKRDYASLRDRCAGLIKRPRTLRATWGSRGEIGRHL